MAGTYIRIDDREARARISEILSGLSDMEPALKAFGEHMLVQTDARFSGEHDPAGNAWQPLSPRTLATKKGKKILTESALLRDSVIYATSPNHMAFGTNKIYGAIHQFGGKAGRRRTLNIGILLKSAIHQFGGKAGRGRKVTIPARAFLGVNAADIDELAATVQDHLTL